MVLPSFCSSTNPRTVAGPLRAEVRKRRAMRSLLGFSAAVLQWTVRQDAPVAVGQVVHGRERRGVIGAELGFHERQRLFIKLDGLAVLVNSVANLGGLFGPTILGQFGLKAMAATLFAGASWLCVSGPREPRPLTLRAAELLLGLTTQDVVSQPVVRVAAERPGQAPGSLDHGHVGPLDGLVEPLAGFGDVSLAVMHQGAYQPVEGMTPLRVHLFRFGEAPQRVLGPAGPEVRRAQHVQNPRLFRAELRRSLGQTHNVIPARRH